MHVVHPADKNLVGVSVLGVKEVTVCRLTFTPEI